MSAATSHPPRHVPQVMISSTFVDLESHRDALIKVIKANGLTDAAMENDSAKLVDVIDSSLQMVRDSSAYVAILGKRYGQIPKCPKRNPNGLSVTELEFNEAVEQGRPILVFIMGKDHLVHEDHIELDPVIRGKLKAFIERAKTHECSEVHRVYAQFDSLEQFKEKIGPAIASLKRFLDEQSTETESITPASSSKSTLLFRAEDQLNLGWPLFPQGIRMKDYWLDRFECRPKNTEASQAVGVQASAASRPTTTFPERLKPVHQRRGDCAGLGGVHTQALPFPGQASAVG